MIKGIKLCSPAVLNLFAREQKITKRSTGCKKYKKLELQPEGKNKGSLIKYYSVCDYCKIRAFA
jgi:hypothetical protein